ncbi:MAG: 4-hydroxythreonine-4-phosphate dehydrogenase PdxA [Candidatus Hydrogenedentes bacterium]|nr:4-hydroxythreonine-4-phosphate dehydrogenase PdxA [Candidatus Hydrogenedentota bacterium]
MKPRLAITLGDVNGVGPEILLKALSNPAVWDACEPVVIGSVGALEQVRSALAGPDTPALRAVAVADLVAAGGPGAVPVVDGGVEAPAVEPGRLDAEAGRCAVKWLRLGVRLAMDGTVGGIVTCPLNKEGIHLAGFAYPGHTEIIAEMTGAPDYRMSLFADGLRIVHITSHCALTEAIAQVRADRIATTIRIADDALGRLGLARRRIAVAALNPHAGEAGAFGTEEAAEIAPAITACREEGIDCSGPHPADTVFSRMNLGEFDLVVAMYHDQGHIPLKLVAMDRGVNVTLGIPIVRTSVDHGTAYDIAGKGIAREDSLLAAIALAAKLASPEAAGRRD